jgi:hypothetical protein
MMNPFPLGDPLARRVLVVDGPSRKPPTVSQLRVGLGANATVARQGEQVSAIAGP